MIELRTGVPGAGKTLHMVWRLSQLMKSWNTKPSEARPVFVLGITDLNLPHSPVPLKSVQINRAGAPSLVPDWDAMPEGSLVIIDEAQGCFPPRSSASTPPEHVAWLNTHRHKGFDIWLTTQHPKLIDASVRALVGKHMHCRRLFGMKKSAVYEWDACSDSLSGMNNSVKSFFNFPKSVYACYKSAEIHTKQSFKLPLWLFIPLIAVVMGVLFFPSAARVLSHGMSGKGIKVDDSPAAAVGALAPTSKPLTVAAVASVPVVQVEKSEPVFLKVAVLAAACVASETRCQCYTQQGLKIGLRDDLCRKAALEPVDFTEVRS